MLILPIKKKWLDMIASGKKKEEYREIKPYYDSRLPWYFEYSKSVENEVVFRNGYSRNSPQLKCKCTLDVGTGKTEWGAEEGKEYYILKILDVKKVGEE